MSNGLAALQKELVRKGMRVPTGAPPARSHAAARARARAMNKPVNVRVAGLVAALRQPSGMACWATVTTMLMSWRDNMSRSIENSLALVGDEWVQLFKNDTGLSSADKPRFLAAAGLIGEPPMSHSVEGWADMLQRFGPLWVTTDENPGPKFSIHARVMVAMKGDGTAKGTTVEFIDPADGRTHRESLAVFLQKYESEAATPGRPLRVQVVHWPERVAPAAPAPSPAVSPAVSQSLALPPPMSQTLGAGISHALNPAVAVAGLGYTVFKDISNNKGDISWTLQRMEGAKYPHDDKTKYGAGPWNAKTETVKSRLDLAFGLDELSATFEVRFQYNGHAVGHVEIQNVGTNDAPWWGIVIDATIMPDPNAWEIGAAKPLSRVDVNFNYHFQHSVRDDVVWIGRYRLYGNGVVGKTTRWP